MFIDAKTANKCWQVIHCPKKTTTLPAFRCDSKRWMSAPCFQPTSLERSPKRQKRRSGRRRRTFRQLGTWHIQFATHLHHLKMVEIAWILYVWKWKWLECHKCLLFLHTALVLRVACSSETSFPSDANVLSAAIGEVWRTFLRQHSHSFWPSCNLALSARCWGPHHHS